MDRNKCKELLPIIQAFAEGKTIQVKNIEGNWFDLNNPKWNDYYEYRIKPTEEYRPYSSTDEMIAEYMNRFKVTVYTHRLPLIWVKTKDTGTQNLITAFDNTVGGSCVFVQDTWKSLADLFEDYEYLDGTPIGVKE